MGGAGGQGGLRASSLPGASPVTAHPQCFSILGGRPAPALHPGACWEGPEACPVGRGGVTAMDPKLWVACPSMWRVQRVRLAALTLGN